jgi:hypothetical protein
MSDYSIFLDDQNARAKFDSRFEVGDPADCWLWTGASKRIEGFDYGVIEINRQRFIASRIALTIAIGHVMPRDIFACHRCDNPPCVNPSHLFAGTCQDNMDDKTRKGRASKLYITHCPHGHPYSGPNLIKDRNKRLCRVCRNAIQRARYARAKSEGKLSPSRLKGSAFEDHQPRQDAAA